MEKNTTVLRSIIFDCDGVLLDSEPVHYTAFKKALGPDGDILTEELYKEQFLALDDRGAFSTFYKLKEMPLTTVQLKDFIDKKAGIFQELVQSEGILPFPAVPELVMALAQRYPLAIASGARKHELEMLLEAAGIRTYFECIVSADDVEKGKPHPESFLMAVDLLNASGKRTTPIKPEECVVIEDSKHGIASAHTAGMKVIAVATSYPAFELSGADLVIPSLATLKVSQIEDLFHPPQPQMAPAPQPN
jgi:beta-phosphoglucomutase